MALPPKGDPRRPLRLAIRSTRLLGGVLLLFGTCALAPFMYMLRSGSGVAASMPPAWTMMMMVLFYFIPGALFMVLSIFLGRRQHWAVVCSLVLSSLLGIVFLLAFTGFAVSVLSNPQLRMAVPAAIIFLFALAVGQLIYHLSKSFEAIKLPPFGQEIRGFEPLPVRPVMGAPPVDPPPPASP